MTLLRTGTIAESDFLGTQKYRLADGSTVPSQQFVIRSLKVGDRTLENVTGSIAPVEGSLLLGQSFLRRFKSWSIDNQRETLILRPISDVANLPVAPTQPATPPPVVVPPSGQFPQVLVGKLLPRYCHMGECTWTSIENRESQGQRGDGELFKVTTRRWHAEYPNGMSYDAPAPRTGGEYADEYVFCSKTRPAVASFFDGKWMADTLSPDQPEGVYGYNSSTYTLYFAACHGLAVEDPSQAHPAALGYRTNSERVNQVEIASPIDMSNLR